MIAQNLSYTLPPIKQNKNFLENTFSCASRSCQKIVSFFGPPGRVGDFVVIFIFHAYVDKVVVFAYLGIVYRLYNMYVYIPNNT